MPSLLVYIAVSASLGALIGLIRQWGKQADAKEANEFAGVRTHTLWAVLGCLGTAASLEYTPLAFPIVMLAVAAQLIAQRRTNGEDAPGSTSFAAAILTMFCGALVVWDETKAAVLVAAVTMVVLGAKQHIHKWTHEVTGRDIRATLQFVAISGVILPLLPDRDLGPFGGFNPFSTWLMVVLISGLGFAGYVSMRLFGARAGILLTAVLGGLASSTASTLAFSRRSREEPTLAEHYALAVIAACTVMLPRVVIATSFVNRDFALTLIVPFAAMALPGIGFAAWVWFRRRPEKKKGDTPTLHNPLNLSTAIKFALLYSAIAFLVKAVRDQGWTEGLLPLAFVSGLTDMDAISLSIAGDYAAGKEISVLATRAVILAAVSNTLLKAGMAVVLGSTGLRWRIGIVLGITAAAGVATMFFPPGWLPFGRPAEVAMP